jgi:hypothetical protein
MSIYYYNCLQFRDLIDELLAILLVCHTAHQAINTSSMISILIIDISCQRSDIMIEILNLLLQNIFLLYRSRIHSF